MNRERTYIGVSASFGRSSIAIVSSRGDIQFAHGSQRVFDRNGNPTHSECLAKLAERYCGSETDIVLALAVNEDSPDACAPAIGLRKASGRGATLREVTGKRCELPPMMRSAEPGSLYSRQCQLVILSLTEVAFEYELERVRGRMQGILEKRRYPTHLAHAAAACFAGPYEEALCAVVDGEGGQSSKCYLYRDGALFEISPTRRPKHEGSLGALMRDVCNASGLPVVRGEHWKAMALAKHGTFDANIYAFLNEYVSADGLCLGAVDHTEMLTIYKKLDSVSRRPEEPILKAADLVCTAQSIFATTLLALLKNLHATKASQNLVFTGECALNPTANGTILERTQFKSLYIPSAPDLGGQAVGAAFLACQEDGNIITRHSQLQTPYLGFEFEADKFEVAAKGLSTCKMEHCKESTSEKAAKLLAAGMTVGWVSERAEFACRALGNRSVFVDPRQVNPSEITGRLSSEFVWPFGISILHEYGSEYFDGYQTSPYGERALKYRPKAARRIPSIVQTDGRVQVQSVRRDWNERLYDLIWAFYSMTGIPLVINLDFGLPDGSPAETPEEVFTMFSACRIDAIFVDDLLIIKQ